MRSNDVQATALRGSVSSALRPMPAGPRTSIDRLRSRERIESIARLRSAVIALDQVDVSGWEDSALTEHLAEISVTLCAIDAQISRLSDAVRARGFRIDEQRAA